VFALAACCYVGALPGANLTRTSLGATKADILWTRDKNLLRADTDSGAGRSHSPGVETAVRSAESHVRPGLRILHLVVKLGAPNTQYNEHCLPLLGKREIAICAFFRDSSLTTPPEITVFDGGGTLRGFLHALRRAFEGRAYDVVHVHAPQTGFLLLLGNLLARRPMTGAVYTLHNCFGNYSIRNQLLLFPVFLAFPRITLCSRSVLDSLPRLLRRIGRDKMSIVTNSVDTERVDRILAGIDRRDRDDHFTAISVSRLIERKNPLALLQAFDRAGLHGARLIFVGDGELTGNLQDNAAALGLSDRITFTGMVGRDDVYRWVSKADVYLSTSRGEGLPIAVLEVMACGIPVILSDIPPHREIAEGVDFIPLIRPGDVAGFARELRRMEQLTPDERAELGRRCRRIVEERFSLWTMHRAYDEVYATITQPEGGSTYGR
jgi:glycosyltransferase involved in cell wall biosynthesis